MNKLWICVGFLALFGVIGHAEGDLGSDYDYYSDEIEKDYPNIKADEVDKDKLSPIDHDALGFNVNLDDIGEVIYDDEYDQALKMLNNTTTQSVEDVLKKGNIDTQDNINDYQIEDNRSEVKEEKQDFGELEENIDGDDGDANEMDVESDEITDDETLEMKDDKILDDASERLQDLANYDQEILQQEASKDVAEMIEDNDNDEEEGAWESPVKDEDTKEEFNKESNNNFDEDGSFNQSQESNLKDVVDDIDRFFNLTEANDDKFSDDQLDDSDEKLNIEQLIEETKRILAETNESFDEDANEKLTSSTSKSAEDSGLDDGENANDSSENKSSTSTERYEIDKDTVAKAYDDLKDDLDHLRATWMKLRDDVTDVNINKESLPGFDELNTKLADIAQEVQDDEDDYEVIDDKDLFKLFKDQPEEDPDGDEMEEIQDQVADDEIQGSDSETNIVVEDKIKSDQSKLIQYVDDALNANEDTNVNHSDDESPATVTTTEHSVKEHPVEPLDDTEIELDIFETNEAERATADPIRITLDLDTPVILTSPNYPRPYPTNAVIDWIIEGKGRGIEFNVTDFALNSIAGDYVMVKPGREDASGSDGFLLAHSLNTPRLFQFLNVDRMFIRFDSRRGLNRFRGFSFSIKLINPPPEERVQESEPRPIGYPEHTLTLNLGGVTLEGFLKIEEEFRMIVANMATAYIEANQINPGLNKTIEVTQITSRAICFHNWPEFEECAEVRFGVPLQYEDEDEEPRLNEEDLRDMWFTYSGQDPFALLLGRLGITEFQVPNDNNVLMVWLVIAAGVVIAMAMLAFALWRFSCFEDYSRMPSFSETESLPEKKALDLYPTPHQTLPPLYGTEYKWGPQDDTRVDMSGYPNRSYVRTEDYEFDSEEEVAVPARDRYTTDV